MVALCCTRQFLSAMAFPTTCRRSPGTTPSTSFRRPSPRPACRRRGLSVVFVEPETTALLLLLSFLGCRFLFDAASLGQVRAVRALVGLNVLESSLRIPDRI